MKRILNALLTLVLVVPVFSQEGGTNQAPLFSFDTDKSQRGYILNIEMGYIHGVNLDVASTATLGTIGEFSDDPIAFYASGVNLHIINGYRVNKHLSAGIGTGIQSWTSHGFYPENDWYIFPLFAEVRATLFNRAVTPYVSFGIGASYIHHQGEPVEWTWFGAMWPTTSFEDTFRFFFHPSAGFSLKILDGFVIDLGFSIAPAGYHFPYYGTSEI